MRDNATLRSLHRRAADAGRRAAAAVGARPTRVLVRVRAYSAPIHSTGSVLLSTTDTEIVPRPRVQPAGGGDASMYAGGPEAHPGISGARAYTIGPITLAYASGGYTLASLLPAESPTTRVTIVLEGEDFDAGGEEFDLAAQPDASRAHAITLTVARTKQGF